MTKGESALASSGPYLSRQQSQNIDRIAIEKFGFTGLMLMENAAAGAARCLLHRYRSGSGGILIACGGGNNGGDGLAMARHLYIAGLPVAVLLVANPERLSPDCATNWQIVRQTAIPHWVVPRDGAGDPSKMLDSWFAEFMPTLQDRWGSIGWVVDGLLGTGATGSLRHPFDFVVARLNDLPSDLHTDLDRVQRMALDLPTGLDCDLGPSGANVYRADLTYTFVSWKQAFGLSSSKQYLGEVVVGSIGIPPEVIVASVAPEVGVQ